jgi:hypothetical protein
MGVTLSQLFGLAVADLLVPFAFQVISLLQQIKGTYISKVHITLFCSYAPRFDLVITYKSTYILQPQLDTDHTILTDTCNTSNSFNLYFSASTAPCFLPCNQHASYVVITLFIAAY